MRLSQPSLATQSNTQVSSACSLTRLWLKTILALGSIPQARNAAVTSRGVVRHGHRVQVDDAIDARIGFLHLDEALDRAEIIAEVQIAGRLDAGKHALGKLRHSSAI